MADTRKSKNDDAYVCVGMITAPHGVRGAVRVKSYTDLVGLTAYHIDGSLFGTVRGVADFGAGDVIEVALEEVRGKVVVLPFTKEAVPEVVLSERKLVVNPPEGLLQDEEGPGNRARRPNKSRKDSQADRDSDAVSADAVGAENATGSGKEA